MCAKTTAASSPAVARTKASSRDDDSRRPMFKSSSSLSSADSSASSSASSSKAIKGTPALPLRYLSLLWLILCATLVTKYNDLIAVFFSFVGSFLAAELLSRCGASDAKKGSYDRNGEGKVGSCHKSVAVKDLVGLLACSASLSALGGFNVFGPFSHLPRGFCTDRGEEFAALAIVTGYLAFDLWYAPLCRPPPSHKSFQVWENALTLSAFAAILARFGRGGGGEGGYEADATNDDASGGVADDSGMAQFRSHLAAWVGYKCVRLVLALSRSSAASPSVAESEDSAEKHKGKIVPRALSDVAASKVMAKVMPPPELVWTVHGRRYDLADFVHRHPGGAQALLLGRGRDCTALFESYHPFTTRHREVLDKYLLKGMEGTPKEGGKISGGAVKSEDNDPFYEVLKARASAALRSRGLDPNLDRASTPLRIFYYVLLFSSLVLTFRLHLRASIGGSILFSIFGWLIGSLGHDGGHYAASRRPWINDLSVWGIGLLCNPIMWQHQHTYAHHSHTNSVEDDPDLHHFTSLLRVHRQFKREGVHGMQRYRAWVIFAYCFVVFGECVKIPLGMLTTGSLYGVVEWTDRHDWGKKSGLVGHYVSYLGGVILGPVLFSERPWYIGMACSVVHMALTGLLFAVFSQINHLNEQALDASSGSGAKLPPKLASSWAARQVVTSNDFCPKSTMWHVLSNGLNLQIEHHLFPGLNHCHLHIVQEEVRRTCEEWGVEYKVYGSWGELMGATMEWMERLSQEEGGESEGKR